MHQLIAYATNKSPLKNNSMKLFTSFIFILLTALSYAQNNEGYKPLDPRDPITFAGDHIIFRGKTITLGPKAFFIDGQLTDEQVAKYPYVFNSVNKASEKLTNGTEDSPMVLYIAPYVYWIDDPDDPAVRVGQVGQSPYALVINCEWLRFYGLSGNAENVVLACNRGQTIGSQGNFTMFRISGDGTSSENITFGNYCNVDLEYPLKPELGRVKRASAIVLAQLIFCNGDKIVARNTRFISRLNLMPFVGGKRVLFDNCHFECTDDAMCATGVYLNSTMDFYSSKPFFATTGTGAVLLNCDVRVLTRGEQYFTKGGGQVAIIDTRFKSDFVTYIGWREVTPGDMRNYQYNVTLNGKPVSIGSKNPELTVDLAGKPLLDAYRFGHNGKVVYNIYNLFRGNDDWDPMDQKDIVVMAGKENGKNYDMIPVQLLVAPSRGAIETKKNDILLTAKVNRFSNCEMKGETINWSVAAQFRSLVELKVSDDGSTCRVIPTSDRDDVTRVIVNASTPSGLEAASVIDVSPSKLDPPGFRSLPTLSMDKAGKLKVSYKLNTDYPDQSAVTWYRCTNSKGANPVEVAVSRFNKPYTGYELSAGDIGYYIMVGVAPKHQRSDPGETLSAIMMKPVKSGDVKANKNILHTDFSNVPTKNQPQVTPGFWTFTAGAPSANNRMPAGGIQGDAWSYGEGTDGAAGQVGLFQGRSGRMLYTPVGKKSGNMKLSMEVVPSKTAGQGFSIANLYMDVLIQFDNQTMSGYALRLIRTTKYGDAVDCMFVRYDNGKVTEISKPVTTSCYRPPCNITVEAQGNRILAHMDSPADYYKQPGRPEVLSEVNIESPITPGKLGGFGIEYNGGAPAMIKELNVDWK